MALAVEGVEGEVWAVVMGMVAAGVMAAVAAVLVEVKTVFPMPLCEMNSEV
jgi:uncharacterized membrane protein YedE/YeeE